MSPLHEAVKSNNIVAVKQLLSDAISDHECRKALFSITDRNACSELLDCYLHNRNKFNRENNLLPALPVTKPKAKSFSQRVSLRFKKSEKFALHQLISEKNTEAAKAFLNSHPCDVNEFNDEGWTPLQLAARDGLDEIAQALINVGADVDIARKDGSTPLYLAAYSGYHKKQFNPIALIEILLKAGANPNIGVKNNSNSSYIPEYTPDYYWADYNPYRGREITPLFLAAKSANQDVVTMLLLHGANSPYSSDSKLIPSCIDDKAICLLVEDYQNNPMAFHEKYSEEEIYVSRRNASQTNTSHTTVPTRTVIDVFGGLGRIAARPSDMSDLQLVRQGFWSPDMTDDKGRSYLPPRKPAVSKKIEQPIGTPYTTFPTEKTNPFADDDEDTVDAMTAPTGASAALGQQQYLLFRPTNNDNNNNNSDSFPLYEAAIIGDIDTIRSRIAKGDNVNRATSKGDTAIHAAAINNQLEAAKVLAKLKADINAQTTSSGKTPLIFAIMQSHPDMVTLLISLGADVNQPMKDGTMPLAFALKTEKKNQAIIDALYDAGARANARPRGSMRA